EAVHEVRKKLIAAVERHLIADAPIGLFLSGGIDSSLLTLIAKPFVGDQLKTLSIVFDDEQFSEKYYQDIIIAQTKAHHQSYLVTEKIFE
ncbi:asparagine synthase-related protein, partial [Acinetobacter baumannii]